MADIKVLIADDHEMVRKGVRKSLEEQPDMDVPGEAVDGEDALQKVKALPGYCDN